MKANEFIQNNENEKEILEDGEEKYFVRPSW